MTWPARCPAASPNLSSRSRTPILALALILALTPGSAHAQRPWTAAASAYVGSAAERRPPALATFTTPAARLMGLEPLHRVSLPAGHRELRVWVGFGRALPFQMLRIVETPDAVRAELVDWWRLVPSADTDGVWTDFLGDAERGAGRYGCNRSGGPTRHDPAVAGRSSWGDWLWACRLDFGPATRWPRRRRSPSSCMSCAGG